MEPGVHVLSMCIVTNFGGTTHKVITKPQQFRIDEDSQSLICFVDIWYENNYHRNKYRLIKPESLVEFTS